MAPSVDGPLATVSTEHHRAVIGRFGDDRYRPIQCRPVVAGQMGQQFNHRPPIDDGGGHGLNTGVAIGEPRLILADESPELPVATDLASFGVVYHHLARPDILQSVGVPLVEGVEILRHRISQTCGPSLTAYPSAAALAKSGNQGISSP